MRHRCVRATVSEGLRLEAGTRDTSLCGNSLFVSGPGFNRAVTAAKSTRL